MNDDYLLAAQELHCFMRERFWNGSTLLGPDQGVRFNRRVGRFIKSALLFLPWADNAYYMQAQGYWVLANWQLFDLVGDPVLADMAIMCADGILKAQQPEGYWMYPHSGWAGRIATVEIVWAALGLLASYQRTKKAALLKGAIRAYDFLVNHTGFQNAKVGYAVNYFANQPGALVPNNATLAMTFFGQLAQATGDERYLTHCSPMLTFLAWAQCESGEFPYALKYTSGDDRPHFQCFQYNAFELQDLAMYFEATHDTSVLPLITKADQFLTPSVMRDGSTRFDCPGHDVHIVYNTAAIAAALGIARRMGLHVALEAENRAYAYVLAQQHPNGGFPFSTREYGVLEDRRYYPRPMSMILHHLLLKAAEAKSESSQAKGQ